jgi:hypothetical protein
MRVRVMNGGIINSEEQIRQKACERGGYKRGITKPEAMADYADRLRERMGKAPNGEQPYGKLPGFANIKEHRIGDSRLRAGDPRL